MSMANKTWVTRLNDLELISPDWSQVQRPRRTNSVVFLVCHPDLEGYRSEEVPCHLTRYRSSR